ncbi:MAG: hypothetical protein ACPL28_11080 [bacterium]
MRKHFYDCLKEKKLTNENAQKDDIELFMYMSLWYGVLYVVIEGWRELRLRDKIIDSLLMSSNVNLLRRYRNAVFHFQKDYYDERFMEFITKGKNCVEWVRNLHEQFGRFFLLFFNPEEYSQYWTNNKSTNSYP